MYFLKKIFLKTLIFDNFKNKKTRLFQKSFIDLLYLVKGYF